MRIPVATLEDLPEGSAAVVQLQGQDVALIHDGGNVYAVEDRCPHAGASLSGGHVENGTITCPWHYWCFKLDTGEYCNMPKHKIKTYPTSIDEGVIYVDVPG
ncbi:MAG: Rieske (2Fe-2S) protein [Fimbriiglobus sp.]